MKNPAALRRLAGYVRHSGRYYAVWAPPSVPDSASLVVTLKIRVKRDGTVLGHELIKSSGNSLMDGSVLAAAEQVTKIEPLPPGLVARPLALVDLNPDPHPFP